MALLRGVNVSGQRRILMADLRRSLEDLGLRRVRDVFAERQHRLRGARRTSRLIPTSAWPRAAPPQSAAAIRARIARDFGHNVEVLVVPSRALLQIAAANPFVGRPGVDEKWLHVTFLLRARGGGGSQPRAARRGRASTS